jgi:hypothetical protein
MRSICTLTSCQSATSGYAKLENKMEHKTEVHPDILEPLDLAATERRVLVQSPRRRNVQAMAYVLGMTAAAMPSAFLGTAEAMAGRPIKRQEEGPLEYDDWLEANYEDLGIEAAESGMDRELGFDFDDFADKRYERYVTEYWRGNDTGEAL